MMLGLPLVCRAWFTRPTTLEPDLKADHEQGPWSGRSVDNPLEPDRLECGDGVRHEPPRLRYLVAADDPYRVDRPRRGTALDRRALRGNRLTTVWLPPHDPGQVMKVITISREYGAGGREVAGRLAGVLGWDLLDHELLHRAAQLEHLPDAELEAIDEQAVSLTDRFRLHPPHQRYLHGLSEAARQAAAQGNVILVGRGSRQLVGEAPDAFHLRLVAPSGLEGPPDGGQRGLAAGASRGPLPPGGPGPRAIHPLLLRPGRRSAVAVRPGREHGPRPARRGRRPGGGPGPRRLGPVAPPG